MPSDFTVFDNNVVMTELDGKAVVVGEKILTACHCISLNLWWDPSLDRKREPSLDRKREPSLETNPMVKLTTATGKEFLANIEFADPISDLVILGCPERSRCRRQPVAPTVRPFLMKPRLTRSVHLGRL